MTFIFISTKNITIWVQNEVRTEVSRRNDVLATIEILLNQYLQWYSKQTTIGDSPDGK